MRVFKINNDTEFFEICKFIKPQKAGVKIMQKKANLNFFYIKDIGFAAANILKQDALSIGAELVCNENVILNGGSSEALLMATDKQVEALVKKEALQDFGLKELAAFLSCKFKKPQKAQIMGVLNINEDSFNPQSRINLASGIEKIEQMIADGADFIDIGGVSSRPGSRYCGREVEFERIKDIVSEIYRLNLDKRVKFSLDSFDEYCLEYALNHGFSLINDISAKLSLCALATSYGASYCLMHMQGSPENMQENPYYDDLLGQIDEFFANFLEAIDKYSVKEVILDVGIGFGKSAADNLFLIKHLEHFLHFEKPILVGASRKSIINTYSKSDVSRRLAGSLYLHQKSIENGASIVRTHDVFEHRQMLNLHEAMVQSSIW